MNDMSMTIQAKSDQLNAADLMEPRTITITRMKVDPSTADQPVSVHFDGDNGKPFKPSKTVRRIMVALWGGHSEEYLGRSMTLYNDPSVIWAGKPVGGIRVSHMSHIEREQTLVLPVSKGKFGTFIIQPLKQDGAASAPKPTQANEGRYVLNGRRTDDLAEWLAAFHRVIAKQTPAGAEALHERHDAELRELGTDGSDDERSAALEIIDALTRAKNPAPAGDGAE